jgi:lipopolysaccharide biosynthesis glycosyltransferase
MSQTFVFLQVGNSIEPTILVKSIRKVMPGARIIQCSDKDTSAVDGISEIFRVEGDINNLMTLRLQAFSALGLASTAIYLDTDMVVLRPLDVDFLIGGADAVVCERSFDREVKMNPNFRDLDFSCYENKTHYEALPYIACFSVTRNSEFWAKAYQALLAMPPIFHYWYGDQEAIKALVQSSEFQIKKVPEWTYGCLPDKKIPASIKPRVLHFKGTKRKGWMLDYLK